MYLMDCNFFFLIDLGWLNAWIPAVAILLLQFVCMLAFKEGGKRAVDTSWYDSKAKRNAMLNSIFQAMFVVLSIFVPLRIGTVWFIVGIAIYAAAILLFVWSFHSYGTAEHDKLITKGIYRYSRNPMYTIFTLALIGITVAGASGWLLLVLVPYIWSMHCTILSEEQYCAQTYGADFEEYMKRVPRYFLFF